MEEIDAHDVEAALDGYWDVEKSSSAAATS